MQSLNLITEARFTDAKPNVQHAVKTDQVLVEAVYMKPGQRTGWHKPDADRAFVCVQGTGELVLESLQAGNEQRLPIAVGGVALAPRGVFYDLVAGPQGLICSALSKFPVRIIEKG